MLALQSNHIKQIPKETYSYFTWQCQRWHGQGPTWIMPSGLHRVRKVAEASLLLAPWKTLCFVAVVMMREMLHSFNLTLFIFGAQLLFTIHTGFAFHPKQKEQEPLFMGFSSFFATWEASSFKDLLTYSRIPRGHVRTWNSCPDSFCWEPCVHHKGFAVGFTKVAFHYDWERYCSCVLKEFKVFFY